MANEEADSPKDSTPKSVGTPTVTASGDSSVRVGASSVGAFSIVVISLVLLALAFALITSLIHLWPTYSTANVFVGTHVVLGVHVNIDLDVNLFLIVILAGAIGGTLHSLRSIALYVGERRLRWSWVLRYACLPIVASLMAIIFYLVIRGGLISAQGSSSDLSPFGIAAVAGLVGLFSDQASEMLLKVFSSLFTPAPSGSDAAKTKANDGTT